MAKIYRKPEKFSSLKIDQYFEGKYSGRIFRKIRESQPNNSQEISTGLFFYFPDYTEIFPRPDLDKNA